MTFHSFLHPSSNLARSPSFTTLGHIGRVTPILRPASTGFGYVSDSRALSIRPASTMADATLAPQINRFIRKRPTSTILIMGDLPSQMLELSSESSASSIADDRPDSPSPYVLSHYRTARRVPRRGSSRISIPPPPSREDSPVSLPDTPAVSPYKAVRRVQSDRFDQAKYERNVAFLAAEEARVAAEEAMCGSSGDEGPSEVSRAIMRARAGERFLLLADEEQRVIRRVMDRSLLIDELLRDSIPLSRPILEYSHAPPRRIPMQQTQIVSRRPNLPTITSNRIFQQNQAPHHQLHHQHPSHTWEAPKTPERAALPTTRNATSTRTPSTTPPSDPLATPPSSNTLPSEGNDEGRCDACGRDQIHGRKMRMMPCAHIVCSTCFSSSISAVSVTHGPSRCTTCLEPVVSFEPVKAFHQQDFKIIDHDDQDEKYQPATPPRPVQTAIKVSERNPDVADQGEMIVMRIDNVAWVSWAILTSEVQSSLQPQDITPAVVGSFLPPDVLPIKHVSPVHILLDRQDGRTKNFCYVEVRSVEAARLILKTLQNTLMPCGAASAGRKRYVTISLTTHKELLDELRPKTSAELHSLLRLCQASILTAHPATSAQGLYVGYNGIAHFVKDRHGPFNALMSILCHLSGKNSPAYWDLFHVTSGAIAAVASMISNRKQSIGAQYLDPAGQPNTMCEETMKADEELLDKLRYLFRTHFCLLSPVGSPS